MSFSKTLKFSFISVLLALFFASCTTNSEDDDGVKGSLVSSKVAGDKVNGLSCQVSKSGSSAFLKLQQFIDGSYLLLDIEYRFKSNGDGTYTIWLYTDLEFKNFPKTDAMAMCKEFLEGVDEDEGSVECGVNGGHVEQILSKYGKPLSDDVIDDMVDRCEESINDYDLNSSSTGGDSWDDEDDDWDDDDDYRDENKESPQFQTGMSILEKGEKLSQQACGASNVGDMFFVMDSAAAFFCDGDGWHRFDEEKGEGKDDEGNASEPIAPSGGNDFSCTVSQENGKVYLRVYMNEMSLIMNAEMVYEQTGTEWLISSRTAYDGPGAEFTAKDECSEYRSDYRSAIASGEMTLVCGEKSVEWSMSEQDVGTSVSQLMFTLQTECDELKQGYNGYDLDGPREKPSDIPTSCKVTEGESSLTLNVNFSDWAYSSTIQINGSTSHEEELFTGDYGDMAEKMCISDKSDPDKLSVTCEGSKITNDGVWDISLTLAEMKELSNYMCDALLDGSMTFEELMFED